jgi:hypothetical protein
MRHIFGVDPAADRRHCLENGMHYCDESDPLDGRNKAQDAYHPDARPDKDSPFDRWTPPGVVVMKCPHCEVSAGVPVLLPC